jgi:hypothetical protein
MERLAATIDVQGPWSLATSRRSWEGCTPAALTPRDGGARLRTVFRVDRDWSGAAVEVSQAGGTAELVLTGDGDLTAAAAQICRFLSLAGVNRPSAYMQLGGEGVQICGTGALEVRLRLEPATPDRNPKSLAGSAVKVDGLTARPRERSARQTIPRVQSSTLPRHAGTARWSSGLL